ncbi:MAG: carboxypeptidase-like regulatory domain-containing protein, partial [Cyclobacteriaceae bacterium]
MKKKIRINLGILFCLLLLPIGLSAQQSAISVSGTVKDQDTNEALSFVTVAVKKATDSTLVTGTISNEQGLFTITDVNPGEYLLEVSFAGFSQNVSPLFVGSNSQYLDLGIILLEENIQQLDEVVVTGKQDAVSGQMDKKTYAVGDNLSQ